MKGGGAPLLTLFRHLQAFVVENRAIFGQNKTLFGQKIVSTGSAGKLAGRERVKKFKFARRLAETPRDKKILKSDGSVRSGLKRPGPIQS